MSSQASKVRKANPALYSDCRQQITEQNSKTMQVGAASGFKKRRLPGIDFDLLKIVLALVKFA